MLQRLVLLGIFILSHSVFAMNGRTTYQAKIVKPDGYPLEAANVNFRFTVLDTVGSCILYVEDYAAVNMQDSGGLISFALGNGARSFPTSGTPQTFQSVFDNSVSSFSCQNAGIYNPISNDTRRVVMQFNDGTGWQTLPAMTINAVPYAMYADKANNARALNNKADTAFVEYATLASLNCNPATHAITFNGVSFSCIPVGSGGGGGGISSVTTSGSVLTTTGTASAPVIGIQAVSLSQDGYLTAVDYAEFKAKLSASSTQIINTLGYEPAKSVSLTSLSNTVAASFAAITSSQWETSGTTISYTAGNVGIGTSDPTALLSIAKILDSQSSTYNGISSNLDIDPSVSGGTRVWGIRTGVTISASSTGNLSSGNPSLTGIEGLVTHLGSGNINKVAAITAGVKNMASGTINEASALRVFAPSSPGLITNLYGLKIENLTTNAANKWAIYQAGSNINSYLEGNLGLGVLAPVTKLDVSGGIRISMESATCAVSYAGTLRYNAGAVEFCNGSTWAALGISGAGLQSFNGSTSATQTFAVGTAGPAPTFSTANGVHTLNIPLASAGTTTAGLISNADYISFTNKLNATSAAVVSVLGYTPAAAVSVTMLASTVSTLTASTAASFAAITSSQWVTSGTDITYNNGNVGIGVSSPSSMLEVKDLTGNLDYNAVIKVVANRSNSERAVMETYTENSTGSDNFIFMTSSIASSAVASINSPPSILMQTFRSTPMVAGDYFGAYLARATDTTGSHFRDAAGLRFMTPDGTTTEFRIGLNSLAGSPGGGFGRAVLTGTNSGNIGVDMINPTAKLNIAAGTNSVAPLKFTSGTLLSSPQSGTVEYDGSQLYFTDGSNTRRSLASTINPGSFENTNSISNSSGNIILYPNSSAGSVVVSAPTASIDSSTGALVVKGGVGVSGNINTSGTLTATGGVSTSLIQGNMNLLLNPNGGNVGIGTTSPNQKLAVANGTVAGNNVIARFGTTETNWQGLYVQSLTNTGTLIQSTLNGISNNNLILNSNGGNVGVGTIVPEEKFHLSNGWLLLDNAYGLRLKSASGVVTNALRTDVNDQLVVGSGDWNSISFHTGAADKLYIASSGAVGIGTITPEYKLQVSGTASVNDKLWASFGNQVMNGYSWVNAAFTTNSIEIVNNNGSDPTKAATLAFHTHGHGGPQFRLDSNGSKVLYLESSNANSARVASAYGGGANSYFTRFHVDGELSLAGRVGIGVINPSTHLDIAGQVQISGVNQASPPVGLAYGLWAQNNRGLGLYSVATGANQGLGIWTNKNGNTPTESVTVLRDGDVGIGTTSPIARLDINGSLATRGAMFRSGIGNTGATGQWVKLGKWTTGQQGRNLLIRIEAGTGYNAITNQMGSAEIRIRTSNASSVNANGFCAASTYKLQGANSFITSVKVVSNLPGCSATSYDVFAFMQPFTGDGSFFTVETDLSSSWQNDVVFGSADPGAASSSVNVASILGNATSGDAFFLNGNVGIGTTSPSSLLTLAASAASAELLTLNNAATGPNLSNKIGFYQSTNQNAYIDSRYDVTNGWSLHLGTRNSGSIASDKVVITAPGNVGVGTSAPKGKMHISQTGVASEPLLILQQYHNVASQTSPQLEFRGYRDVDANQPLAKIVAQAQTDEAGELAQSGSLHFWTNDYGIGGSYAERMMISQSGNVGIGTTNPSHKLDVNGTIRGFGITDSSDIRLKESIQPLEQSLEKILQVDGVAYHWKDKSMPKKQIGFIAQQLETVFPELVETDNQGMKSVNYSHLVAPLVEAVKSLYSRVVAIEEQMRREVASLAQSKAEKSEVEQLKQENVEIKKQNEQLIKYLCAKDPQADFCN